MRPAAEKMKSLLKDINFIYPDTELINNVNALPISKDDDIKDLLYKQIFSQVKWRESIEFMIENQVNEFVEIGPGKVLSGLVKRTSDKVKSISLNTLEDIKNLDDKS